MKIEEDVLGGGAWKILVVDDESTIREVLVDFLVLEGFEVTCANDGEQGLEMLATQHFDALLLDYELTSDDGVSLARRVRGDKALVNRHVPIILLTARIFVPYEIAHPVFAFVFILLVAASFSLFGFILGIWADNFEKLGIIPMLFLTPLTFLGGTFYSIDMLPEPWDTIALANPIVYLVSGLRWTFYGSSDVDIGVSFAITLGFLACCVAVIAYIFRTGWRIRS